MSIFQKKTGNVHYFDQISIGGYSFDAEITVRPTRGDPSAIHCGRIISFQLICEDDIIAFFDDGMWYSIPDESLYIDNDPFPRIAKMAIDILLKKWGNPEKINNKIEITNMF